MFISNLALKNRTTVAVLILLITVAGVFSYAMLPRESAPDVPIPYVLVSTVYEGVSPEDVETAVTMKIEQELTGIKGVKEIRSTSREGLSFIQIEFDPDIDVEDALQYVRDKVDQAKPELPSGAEEPALTEVNISEFPILIASLSGDISPERLRLIAEELEDRIERIAGVLDCEVTGALEREIRLEFDPDRLAAYAISIDELISLIPGENVNISAGGLQTPGTRFNVRVEAEFADPADIDHLLLTVRDGRPIYLNDVATVVDTFKDRETFSRLDGDPSITLSVKKRAGANIVQVAQHVKAIFNEARSKLPAGVEVDVTSDQSKDTLMMVRDLENNILSGLVLVVAVLMFAMGLRTSLIVALVIPLSMLMSFAILQAMHITLNMVVLFSLILALGMLVDNAIVIVENIYRYRQQGAGRLEAARAATAEVAWPVISSTATTVAAFAPLIFWPGIMGEFMKYLPITVIVVLSSSLFVALVINPVAASMLIRVRRPSDSVIERPGRFMSAYRRLVYASLHSAPNRAVTLIVAFLVLAGVRVLYGKYHHGVELFPQPDPQQAVINIRAPQGTNVSRTDELARLVERRIAEIGRRENLELEHVLTNVGSPGGMVGLGEQPVGPHVADVRLIFKDFEDRRRRTGDVIAGLRPLLADIPGAEIKVDKMEEGPPVGAPVTLEISGDDFKVLEALSRDVVARIQGTPGMVDLRSDFEPSRPELQFVPDRRRTMLLGVNTNMIGQFLQTAVFGREVGIYRQFNDEYDITLRLPLSQRTNIEDLLRLTIPNAQGDPVPLSSLGRFEYRGGFGDIRRVDQKRVITLTADAEGRPGPAVLADVRARLDGLDLPTGYSLAYTGENEEQQEAMGFLGQAYAIAILAILMILVAQFNTMGAPVIILITVILSLAGVGVGLLVTGTPFVVIMTGIGVVSLAGVVVNNAIVLLDYTRQLEKQGKGLLDAAVEAGMTRLRPVLLTAITTILGLVPMATGIAFDFRQMRLVTGSESSQWWAPLANAMIFGLGFTTLLTLVVVPAMYVAMYSLLERLGFGGLRRPDEGEPPAPTT
ncbi:MAG: efflux RND transporter permease subunit [Planctomycetes bacterium]|nr:efflux RND transporter permease subunit [Planctomycetota bacterium]